MIYRAIVADNRDPAQQGRLKVMIPALSGSAISDWIWPVIPVEPESAPDAGGQVWVMFENGDQDVPVWIGVPSTPSGLTDRLAVLEDILGVVYEGSNGAGSASSESPVLRNILYVFDCAPGQSTFSGPDKNGNDLVFTGDRAAVYLNGVLLTPGTDYSAAENAVTLALGAAEDDVLVVLPLL